jgi:hypothetical protein
MVTNMNLALDKKDRTRELFIVVIRRRPNDLRPMTDRSSSTFWTERWKYWWMTPGTY